MKESDKKRILEARALLREALIQVAGSDDKIIVAHIRTATKLLDSIDVRKDKFMIRNTGECPRSQDRIHRFMGAAPEKTSAGIIYRVLICNTCGFRLTDS